MPAVRPHACKRGEGRVKIRAIRTFVARINGVRVTANAGEILDLESGAEELVRDGLAEYVGKRNGRETATVKPQESRA